MEKFTATDAHEIAFKSVQPEYLEIIEEIKIACNDGKLSIRVDHNISDSIKNELKINGYKVEERILSVGYYVIISW